MCNGLQRVWMCAMENAKSNDETDEDARKGRVLFLEPSGFERGGSRYLLSQDDRKALAKETVQRHIQRAKRNKERRRSPGETDV